MSTQHPQLTDNHPFSTRQFFPAVGDRNHACTPIFSTGAPTRSATTPCYSSCSSTFSSQALNITPARITRRHVGERSRSRQADDQSRIRHNSPCAVRITAAPIGRIQFFRPTAVIHSRQAPKPKSAGSNLVAKGAFTSFYSSSTSSLESLGTSPATSLESLPFDMPSSAAKGGAIPSKPSQKYESAIEVDMRRFSKPNRLSLKRSGPSTAMTTPTTTTNSTSRTSKDLSLSPLSSSVEGPRQSFSAARRSLAFKRSSTQAQPEGPRGPLHYYQDPEARKKLKNCLASPQNFEKALEQGFGFASTAMSPPMTSEGPRVQPDFSDNHVKGFLKDSHFLDTSSQFGAVSENEHESELSEADDESQAYERGKYINFEDQAYNKRASRHARKSTSSRLNRKNLGGDMFGEREMTLRLTLTRPEARDDNSASRLQTRVVTREPSTLGGIAETRGSTRREDGQAKMQGIWRKLKPRR